MLRNLCVLSYVQVSLISCRFHWSATKSLEYLDAKEEFTPASANAKRGLSAFEAFLIRKYAATLNSVWTPGTGGTDLEKLCVNTHVNTVLAPGKSPETRLSRDGSRIEPVKRTGKSNKPKYIDFKYSSDSRGEPVQDTMPNLRRAIERCQEKPYVVKSSTSIEDRLDPKSTNEKEGVGSLTTGLEELEISQRQNFRISIRGSPRSFTQTIGGGSQSKTVTESDLFSEPPSKGFFQVMKRKPTEQGRKGSEKSDPGSPSRGGNESNLTPIDKTLNISKREQGGLSPKKLPPKTISPMPVLKEQNFRERKQSIDLLLKRAKINGLLSENEANRARPSIEFQSSLHKINTKYKLTQENSVTAIKRKPLQNAIKGLNQSTSIPRSRSKTRETSAQSKEKFVISRKNKL